MTNYPIYLEEARIKNALKRVLIGCPETSVQIYHYSLRNNPEGRSCLVVSRFSWNVNLISACPTFRRWTRSDAIDSLSHSSFVLNRDFNIVLSSIFNLLMPNVNYSGRTASLTSKVAFYIFIQQI